MDHVMIATSLLTLLAGIGVFLIACHMMSSSLEAMSSSRLRHMFARMSGNKWLGVGIGAGATALIQSSGATSVMVIGFINAGVMSLHQAATILFGANVGTTITGQIVAMGMFGKNTISTTVIFSAMAGIGAFLSSFSKNEKQKMIGEIIAGFGMLFVGLSMMSGAMESFAQLEGVKLFLAGISNAILLVVIGALLTAIVQSSSVMTSVAIAMVVAGLINLDQGIYLTMGSNIGSCVVALVAGLTSSKNAKRASLIHLFFNIGGVIIFLVIAGVLRLVTGGSVSLSTPFMHLFRNAPQTQLAMFHTVFNVITVFIAVPLTNVFVRLVTRIVPGEEKEAAGEEAETKRLYYIDDNLLATPPIAVAQTRNEIVNMAQLAMENFHRSLRIVCAMDFSEEDTFYKTEDELDYLNKQLVRFLAHLLPLKLSEKDSAYVSTAFRTVSDLERIGDYAENIVEYAEALRTTESAFPEKALAEIHEMENLIDNLFEKTLQVYTKHDRQTLKEALAIEDEIDRLTERMTAAHIRRVNEGVFTASTGSQYLALASDAERVADHLVNVANSIKELPSTTAA